MMLKEKEKDKSKVVIEIDEKKKDEEFMKLIDFINKYSNKEISKIHRLACDRKDKDLEKSATKKLRKALKAERKELKKREVNHILIM